MMRKLAVLALLAALATAALAPPPAARAAARCPNGFHPHAIIDGEHEHGHHQHVGRSMDAVDRNGNGWICVRHVTPAGDIHVHIDDIAPPGRDA
jgi:hypothetical protein